MPRQILGSVPCYRQFTAVVYSGEVGELHMAKERILRRTGKVPDAPWVRASISFPPDLYATLEELAKQKKVSLAWVVRDASEKYVAVEKSLPGGRQERS